MITVTGETYVGGGAAQVAYRWECSVAESDTELHARIVDFGPAPDAQ